MISTTFLVGFLDTTHLLAIRNERGWDLPGGHLQPPESCLDGLRREVLEEAGATFETALPFVVLTSTSDNKSVLGFVSHTVSLQPTYIPIDDAFERAVLTQEEIIEKYFGDKKLIKNILMAAERIKN